MGLTAEGILVMRSKIILFCDAEGEEGVRLEVVRNFEAVRVV